MAEGDELILHFFRASMAKVIKVYLIVVLLFSYCHQIEEYKLFVSFTRCSYNDLNSCKNCLPKQ